MYEAHGDQTAGNDEETFPVDRRQLAPSRKRDDQIAVTYRRATPRNDKTATWRACESLDRPLGLARVTHVNRNHLNLEHRCHSLNDAELGGLRGDAGIPQARTDNASSTVSSPPRRRRPQFPINHLAVVWKAG